MDDIKKQKAMTEHGLKDGKTRRNLWAKAWAEDQPFFLSFISWSLYMVIFLCSVLTLSDSSQILVWSLLLYTGVICFALHRRMDAIVTLLQKIDKDNQ